MYFNGQMGPPPAIQLENAKVDKGQGGVSMARDLSGCRHGIFLRPWSDPTLTLCGGKHSVGT